MLEKGYHVAHLDTANLFGGPEAIRRWNQFYDFLVNKHGLAKKAALEGLSRGGLFVFNWASENPDKVACIYADAPVCDIKSWPFGLGDPEPAVPSVEEACLKACEITRDQLEAYKGNPIDRLEPIAKAGIHDPLRLRRGRRGRSDQRKYTHPRTAVSGTGRSEFACVVKPNCGHHPHGLDDPTLIIEFIDQETKAALAAEESSTGIQESIPRRRNPPLAGSGATSATGCSTGRSATGCWSAFAGRRTGRFGRCICFRRMLAKKRKPTASSVFTGPIADKGIAELPPIEEDTEGRIRQRIRRRSLRRFS